MTASIKPGTGHLAALGSEQQRRRRPRRPTRRRRGHRGARRSDRRRHRALADATAFAQWDTARRLAERGAEANLFEAAAVGLLDRVAALLAALDPPAPERINDAFWAACHGGQTQTAQLLLDNGAALDWLPAWEELTPLDAAIRSEAADTITWLTGLGAHEAEALQ